MAGASLSYSVTALDAFNNIVTGYTGTIHFTSTDGVAVLPGDYTFVAGDAGTYSFGVTLVTAGSRGLTVTDTGNSSINGSGSVLVAPTAATHFSASAAASTMADAALVHRDGAGCLQQRRHRLHGSASRIQHGHRGAAAGRLCLYRRDAGVHTFSLTLKTAGPDTLTATDTRNVALGNSTPRSW